MSNLSLLSRGNAQVVKTSQEKIEVYYEPEDYFNWRSYQAFHTQRILSPGYGSHKHWEVPTPKTYSTKKGALVLYSEDLALPWYGAQGKRFKRGHKYQRKKLKLQLSTLQDFTGAILTYGRKQTDNSDTHWKPYLHFINEETAPADKQIRPGYSPKRYLAHLFKTWDPNTLYKLQQAGSLRDSVQFQQLTTNMTETSRRHQDLSSVPLKYHCLPVFSSLPLPQWTLSDAFTNPGRCTPVQEESGNEEELGDEEKTGGPSKNLDLSVPCNGTVRKVSAEPKESVRSWKRQGELLESQQCEEIITSDRSEFSHITDPFWKDSIPPTQSKPHATFYGGSFSGRRLYQPGKQDIMKHKNDKDVSIQEGGFLPPILQAHGSESNAVRNQNVKTQEPLRLPPILEETPRVAQPNRRLRASEPPKELLVIPLLVRFENQKSNADENSKPREAAMKEQHGQGVAMDQYVQPQLTDEVQVPSLERKMKTLQMDIDWNVDKQQDGDINPIPEAQLVGSLPPINGKKGPGNQSSMANLKMPTVGNGSSTQGSKILPTGIIRGSIPEELKECCKGSSVGSLIMSPNGEIVCLSLVGAARDTDIPVRFDFIPEQEEEDCLALESTGQDEQCPGNQKTSEEANVGSNTSFDQPLEEESTTQVYRAKKHHPHVNRLNLQEDNAISRHQPPIGKIRRRAGEKNNGISMEINQKNGEDVKKERTSAGRNNVKSEEKIVYKGGECETGNRDLGQEPMKDVVIIPSGQRLSENDFQDIEAFQSIDEEEEDDEEEEESTPPKTMLRSTPSPDMNFESKAQDQAPVVKGPHIPKDSFGTVSASENQPTEPALIATLPSRRKERIEQKHETKLDKLSTRTDTSKVTSQNKSEFKEQKLEKNGIGAEEIQDNETKAPSSVQAEQHSNQVELNIKGPNKQNISKEKTSGSPRKLPLQPISKSSEIMDKVSIDKEEKTSVITAQEVKRNIHNENQPVIEEEDMVLLQDIASSMKKETSWAKGKKRTKSEKTQKANKNPTAVSKTAKPAGVTQQGKAAFVVGQPKDKKAEGTISPPKKTLRQVHRQDTSNVFQDIERGDKEEEEECMSIGSSSMENEERNTTLAQSSDTIHSVSEDEVVPTLSSREADVPVDKPMARTLEVPLAVSQTSDDDTANSEISDATSGPLQKQKSSRARELSEKAERRRIEVEKKRKEREEQLKLEKEQQDRMEKMREELEQEQRRREEEARLKKQQQEQEKQRMEQEMVRKKQLEQQALERARQQQEEHRRKLQEMQRRKQQEELERIELERQRQREKEQMEAEERLRLLEMAAEEREEYKRKKQEKEEQAQREAEERRQRAEEEAKAVMEEARRQAQLLAKQTAELEQQLLFNQGLWQESVGMDQTQSISRPWVFSYYEFLQLLGLPLPVEAE
ncbi:uncharacterized protein KIAA2012 homolog isoform X2 [Spea bombifrons]|uniref:uncharacterized protein KIAA2012 homolog isoform X2 n=1 Tax=Spea bombifrons TaxID=233779 RepID=UPI0023493288|nr:uncharacterized protein KIAA2012 homolog isoform X2 [Spea bombifrons]